VRTWLIGILKHKIIDSFRREAREVALDDPERLSEDDIDTDAAFKVDGHWAERLAGVIWLTDVGSTNGTFVNGERIQRHCLCHADVISIGTYSARFLSEAPLAEARNTSPVRLDALGAPGSASARKARLLVLEGAVAGQEVPLVKTVTTFGKPGTLVVSVMKRPQGYFLAHVEGTVRATVNAQPVGDQPYPLVHRDKINVAGIQLEMCFKP